MCRPLAEAPGNASAAGGVERGWKWEQADVDGKRLGFRSHAPDTWSTNGRKDRKEKKDGREGRKEEVEERRKKRAWPEEELTVLGLCPCGP